MSRGKNLFGLSRLIRIQKGKNLKACINVENTAPDLQVFLWCLPLSWGAQAAICNWDHPPPGPHCPRWGHWLCVNYKRAIRDEPDECQEPGARCLSWAQPPRPSTSLQSHSEASAAKNPSPVRPGTSLFLGKTAADYTSYCLRYPTTSSCNVKSHTSRIQMNIRTRIILYLSLWDSDNYCFRMGSKSTDLQRLFEVNIYLL